LRVDADDDQALRGALHRAQVAGHALAGEHAPRILRHAGRAGLVVRDRVAVARAIGREVVPLDHSGESLALREPRDVDDLPALEDVDADLAAGLKIGQPLPGPAERAQKEARLGCGLLEMARGGLVDARGAALAEGDLNGVVAVARGGFDLRDAVV